MLQAADIATSAVDDGEDAAARTAGFMDFRFRLASQANVVAAIGARRPAGTFAYVVTPNVDHVIRLQHRRSDLWPAYRHAWMTLCDSRILAWLAARAGLMLPLVPGSDLTRALFRDVVRPGDRIAILGGSAASVADLCRDYRLTDVVHLDPPMGFVDRPSELARAIDFLVAAHARYAFLAVGSPQQEIVAYQVEQTGAATGVGLCVGASLDFLTGRQHRAPRAIQLLALEWLFRLLSDPRRFWRRYLVDGPMIFRLHRDWRRRRVAS